MLEKIRYVHTVCSYDMFSRWSDGWVWLNLEAAGGLSGFSVLIALPPPSPLPPPHTGTTPYNSLPHTSFFISIPPLASRYSASPSPSPCVCPAHASDRVLSVVFQDLLLIGGDNRRERPRLMLLVPVKTPRIHTSIIVYCIILGTYETQTLPLFRVWSLCWS